MQLIFLEYFPFEIRLPKDIEHDQMVWCLWSNLVEKGQNKIEKEITLSNVNIELQQQEHTLLMFLNIDNFRLKW